MPKGTNPNSHRNKPLMGTIKRIMMSENYWAFSQVLGAGSFAQGIREAVRAIQIISQGYLRDAATVLDCDRSPDSIKSRLIELFPEIQQGRKTADDLVAEIILGECFFERNDRGLICRVVRVVEISIPSPKNDGTFLVELRQEYPNKAPVIRPGNKVSEKIQGNENPIDAAIRGINEELSIHPDKIKSLGKSIKDNPHSAYKGIQSKTHLFSFHAEISLSDWQFEYQEIQQNKTTIFGWR